MAKLRDVWVGSALIVSLLVIVYFVVAALGTKFGLLDWTLGFVAMTLTWGVPMLLGAGVFALLAVLLALFVQPRRGIISALVALAVPAAALGYGIYVRQAAADIPPIHDISTDLTDPPGFSEDVVQARAAITNGNDLELLNARTPDGASVIDLQRAHYADIQPLITPLDPTRTFDIALDLAREQGWTITHADSTSGRIEAIAESFWFGFKDDIAIRIRPEGNGARVDMRSVSRVGRSDLGANAARMRPYLAVLAQRTHEARQS